MQAIKFMNLGLRFLLEIANLAIFMVWGWRTGSGPLLKWLLAIALPLAAAAAWGALLAPKAPRRLRGASFVLVEVAIFALAGWALYALAGAGAALVYIGIYALHRLLFTIWRQDAQQTSLIH